jgi:hypothetical protein
MTHEHAGGSPRLSIIVEWDNAQLAELERAKEMLRRLATQVPAWARSHAPGDANPVETLIMFNDEEVDADDLARLVEEHLPAETSGTTVRLVEARGKAFYALKNHGAETARGDLLVFVDSDVIPDPDWLERLVAPFDDPGVRIVAGHTYTDPAGIYGKAFALTWLYDLRYTEPRLEPIDFIWTNNFAVRRETFLEFRFPLMDDIGSARGGCYIMSCNMREAGITIWCARGAQVCHPAPNGVRHFVDRGLAQGRDDFLIRRALGNDSSLTLLATVRRFLGKEWWSVRRIVGLGRRVGLGPHQAPVALVIAGAYYVAFFAGQLATKVAPERMLSAIRV